MKRAAAAVLLVPLLALLSSCADDPVVAEIDEPADGATFVAGTDIRFSAQVGGGPVLTYDVRWSSSRDGELHTDTVVNATSFTTSSLSVGTHEISLSVSFTAGNRRTTFAEPITIEITAPGDEMEGTGEEGSGEGAGEEGMGEGAGEEGMGEGAGEEGMGEGAGEEGMGEGAGEEGMGEGAGEEGMGEEGMGEGAGEEGEAVPVVDLSTLNNTAAEPVGNGDTVVTGTVDVLTPDPDNPMNTEIRLVKLRASAPTDAEMEVAHTEGRRFTPGGGCEGLAEVTPKIDVNGAGQGVIAYSGLDCDNEMAVHRLEFDFDGTGASAPTPVVSDLPNTRVQIEVAVDAQGRTIVVVLSDVYVQEGTVTVRDVMQEIVAYRSDGTTEVVAAADRVDTHMVDTFECTEGATLDLESVECGDAGCVAVFTTTDCTDGTVTATARELFASGDAFPVALPSNPNAAFTYDHLGNLAEIVEMFSQVEEDNVRTFTSVVDLRYATPTDEMILSGDVHERVVDLDGGTCEGEDRSLGRAPLVGVSDTCEVSTIYDAGGCSFAREYFELTFEPLCPE